ncbi:uncharacterized protein PAC_07628 [Phialocephala subalpina]|uniref:Uncharacterized protein n=1 Tax=Phialocephala subalpina TaxID=576137 RepID=A0A1L7WY98_9HELO|nr:uncharacterized protein PAC_07628 [Phialocephala subalpina]
MENLHNKGAPMSWAEKVKLVTENLQCQIDIATTQCKNDHPKIRYRDIWVTWEFKGLPPFPSAVCDPAAPMPQNIATWPESYLDQCYPVNRQEKIFAKGFVVHRLRPYKPVPERGSFFFLSDLREYVKGRLKVAIETTIGKEFYASSSSKPNYCAPDPDPPNSFRWVFSRRYPGFPKTTSNMDKDGLYDCIEALESGDLRVERIPNHKAIDPEHQRIMEKVNRIAKKNKYYLRDEIMNRFLQYINHTTGSDRSRGEGNDIISGALDLFVEWEWQFTDQYPKIGSGVIREGSERYFSHWPVQALKDLYIALDMEFLTLESSRLRSAKERLTDLDYEYANETDEDDKGEEHLEVPNTLDVASNAAKGNARATSDDDGGESIHVEVPAPRRTGARSSTAITNRTLRTKMRLERLHYTKNERASTGQESNAEHQLAEAYKEVEIKDTLEEDVENLRAQLLEKESSPKQTFDQNPQIHNGYQNQTSVHDQVVHNPSEQRQTPTSSDRSKLPTDIEGQDSRRSLAQHDTPGVGSQNGWRAARSKGVSFPQTEVQVQLDSQLREKRKPMSDAGSGLNVKRSKLFVCAGRIWMETETDDSFSPTAELRIEYCRCDQIAILNETTTYFIRQLLGNGQGKEASTTYPSSFRWRGRISEQRHDVKVVIRNLQENEHQRFRERSVEGIATDRQPACYVLRFDSVNLSMTEIYPRFSNEGFWGLHKSLPDAFNIETWATVIGDNSLSFHACTTPNIERLVVGGEFDRPHPPCTARYEEENTTLLLWNTGTRLIGLLEKKLGRPIKTSATEELSPYIYDVGPQFRYSWRFSGHYNGLCDRSIAEWSLPQHLDCNKAIDEGWIEPAIQSWLSKPPRVEIDVLRVKYRSKPNETTQIYRMLKQQVREAQHALDMLRTIHAKKKHRRREEVSETSCQRRLRSRTYTKQIRGFDNAQSNARKTYGQPTPNQHRGASPEQHALATSNAYVLKKEQPTFPSTLLSSVPNIGQSTEIVDLTEDLDASPPEIGVPPFTSQNKQNPKSGSENRTFATTLLEETGNNPVNESEGDSANRSEMRDQWPLNTPNTSRQRDEACAKSPDKRNTRSEERLKTSQHNEAKSPSELNIVIEEPLNTTKRQAAAANLDQCLVSMGILRGYKNIVTAHIDKYGEIQWRALHKNDDKDGAAELFNTSPNVVPSYPISQDEVQLSENFSSMTSGELRQEILKLQKNRAQILRSRLLQDFKSAAAVREAARMADWTWSESPKPDAARPSADPSSSKSHSKTDIASDPGTRDTPADKKGKEPARPTTYPQVVIYQTSGAMPGKKSLDPNIAEIPATQDSEYDSVVGSNQCHISNLEYIPSSAAEGTETTETTEPTETSEYSPSGDDSSCTSTIIVCTYKCKGDGKDAVNRSSATGLRARRQPSSAANLQQSVSDVPVSPAPTWRPLASVPPERWIAELKKARSKGGPREQRAARRAAIRTGKAPVKVLDSISRQEREEMIKRYKSV